MLCQAAQKGAKVFFTKLRLNQPPLSAGCYDMTLLIESKKKEKKKKSQTLVSISKVNNNTDPRLNKSKKYELETYNLAPTDQQSKLTR